MWPHFEHLVWRIIHGMPVLVSSNWANWGLGLAIFVLYEVFAIKFRGWQDVVSRWKQNVGLGLLATAGGYVLLFAYSAIITTYDEHHDSTGRWQAVVKEKDNLKVLLQQKDEYIKKLESKPCPACPVAAVRAAPVSAVPPKPTIKAFARDLGTDKDGFFITELTLSSDVPISPPLTIQLDFDAPIYGIETVPSPTPAVRSTGGERWQGTHAWATIPNTGLNPNLLWITRVKSKSRVNLINPPRMQIGY
jgi:hypothetical protein